MLQGARGIAFIEFYVIPGDGGRQERIEFPPRWNNSGARGFDRPSIAMGTGDSYDARKRVASVPLETGTGQPRREKERGRKKSWKRWRNYANKNLTRTTYLRGWKIIENRENSVNLFASFGN